MSKLLFCLALFVFFAMFHVEQLLAGGQAPDIAGWFEIVKTWLDVLAQATFSLMIFATILVRVIPNKKYAENVYSWSAKIQKWLGWLPTIGVNPNTKKLKAALEELKKNEPS